MAATRAEDDQEEGLLLASAHIAMAPSQSSPNGELPPAETKQPVRGDEIHIREDKLFAQLTDGGGRDHTHWILDTGATNHMTGARSAFSKLDEKIRGTVWFGDGSVVSIEGRRNVLIVCKNGESRRLARVYYIPRL